MAGDRLTVLASACLAIVAISSAGAGIEIRGTKPLTAPQPWAARDEYAPIDVSQ
jgi:hypothetical protein